MAGKYIEFVNPGYSTLYTRDFKYAQNTSRGDDVANPFDPDAANPLIEGEWLQMAANNRVTRGGDAASATASADYNVAVSPCLMHFSERGRYDVQITKKAHCVTGPQGFEFTCKLGDFTGGAAGDRVYIMDFENPSASGKYIQAPVCLSALDNASSSAVTEAGADGSLTATHQVWSPGWIVRHVSATEVVIMFDPQYIALNFT